MAEVKTKKNTASVTDFINAVPDEQKRKDSKEILKMLKRITGKSPVMWGTAIIGFGKYTYEGSDKKVNEWPAVAFSPRKQNLTLYVLPGYDHAPMQDLLAKLGKHSRGKSCLYIKKLSDVDMKVLEQIAKKGYKAIAGKHIVYGTTTLSL